MAKVETMFTLRRAYGTDYDYACSAWYPNLNAKLKKTLQITQNKCIHFCLKLDKMHHISEEDFKTINWLPVLIEKKN